MQGPSEPLPPSVMAFLPAWVARQRWYAGKGRVPRLQHIGILRLEDPAGEVDIDIHLLLDESGQTRTTYQVPLTSRGARLAGADHALIATVGSRYIYDAPHDPVFTTALLRMMLEEGTAANPEQASDAEQGSTEKRGLSDAEGHLLATTDPGKLLESHVLKGEQSNTSIILERVDALGASSKPLICKLFRVLHHGQNPDVTVQSALATAGSTRVPRSVGYVSGQWPDASAPEGMAAGHLVFAQEFLPGVEDAWRVALAAIAKGTDFSEQARSLGHATAQVHATLAEAMGTREATEDDAVALTRSMRARHAAACSEVPALAAYDSMIHASIEAVSFARWPALQRIHGDYHLGQVLDAPGRGWVLIDFEGEPLRPLAERNQPDLALRDVAGMLRSFDYVAGSWEQAHPGRSAAQKVDPQRTKPQPIEPQRTEPEMIEAEMIEAETTEPELTEPGAWAARARTAFLEGYTSSAGRDPREEAVLLNALELDKALYEVVYEARNRPTWLSIPTTAIDRLAHTARLTAGPRSDLPS